MVEPIPPAEFLEKVLALECVTDAPKEVDYVVDTNSFKKVRISNRVEFQLKNNIFRTFYRAEFYQKITFWNSKMFIFQLELDTVLCRKFMWKIKKGIVLGFW